MTLPGSSKRPSTGGRVVQGAGSFKRQGPAVSSWQNWSMPEPTTTLERTNVLGVGVSAINMDLAVSTMDGWINSGDHQYVCVTGVHGVMESQSDAELRQIHNDAGLVTPDGMPMVWLSRKAGFDHVSRVYGPDLMLAMCERSVEAGFTHFFYGGNDGVADLLKEKLTERFPGLKVVGTHCPPFRPLTEEEDAAVVAEINASGADVVWVGLSTPKQERWMATHVGKVNAAALIGVGAAFDFHAGLKKQAPVWIQRSGFEWFYRMVTEPRRLAKRYLVNNPRFLALAAAQHFGRKKYEL